MRIARKIVVCLACAAVAALIASCARPAAAQWKDGAYPGKAEGVHGEIDLTVTVAKGKITKVEVTHQNEAAGVSDLAFQRVPQEIVDKTEHQGGRRERRLTVIKGDNGRSGRRSEQGR